MVSIRHPNGYETRYAHLRGFARGIRSGVAVRSKQVIGYVGSTGLATGAHLHYELRKGNRAVNARTATPPPAPPLAGDAKVAFDAALVQRQALLDSETQLYLARASVRATRVAND
jgi:murein DD-endopeptidase MepM/ murein hydrolase activator NlpD